MDELIEALQVKVADAAQCAAALKGEDRTDDANLEKIRGNVYGIFISVLQAAAGQSPDEEAQRRFFEGNLERIPSSWRVARQKAEERGDVVRLVQEDVKLAALAEVEHAYRDIWGTKA